MARSRAVDNNIRDGGLEECLVALNGMVLFGTNVWYQSLCIVIVGSIGCTAVHTSPLNVGLAIRVVSP